MKGAGKSCNVVLPYILYIRAVAELTCRRPPSRPHIRARRSREMGAAAGARMSVTKGPTKEPRRRERGRGEVERENLLSVKGRGDVCAGFELILWF